jgi:aryl-alcohol dehydrogenase-like predicted oxidoreductase
MKYVHVGQSGLEVSSVIVGCMSFGDPKSGNHSWSLGLDESRGIIRQALDAGITTFDTANVYSAGSSEEIVGQVLQESVRREDVVIATKVHGRMRPGPGGAGLSRRSILHEIDDSLRRLRTDYVDLYQIHRFDPDVPIEETMEALHDVVKAGKARYLGASSMFAWQFAQMQHTAEMNGWTTFISMQDQYSLISREEEREMLPFCLATGVGALPWSPLARGRLARPWGAQTSRSKTDRFGTTLYHQAEDSDRRIIQAVGEVAQSHGVSRAQVALAWLARQEAVTAPIVGMSTIEHLNDAVASVDLVLTDEEAARLADPYTPREPEGF